MAVSARIAEACEILENDVSNESCAGTDSIDRGER